MADSFDFIIVGAGIAGTVLASRLHERDPSLSILLIEAGSDASDNPLVPNPLTAALLRGTEVDWNLETVPQKHLGGSRVYIAGGKAIGGGSVINFGEWTRGDAKDYDDWAKLVGDQRWSYAGLLPYFRKTEHHEGDSRDEENHGYDGPVPISSITSSGRNYPLREPIKRAWESLGVQKIPNLNSGSPLGLAENVEARDKGMRVIASSVYPLNGVHVMSATMVKRVLLEREDDNLVAKGVELINGKQFTAKREVILSAGAIHTPKILMLSGIGPAEELKRHGIELKLDNPEVGKNHWDHIALRLFWKLKHPENGASIGSPAWKDPSFAFGNPIDWIVSQTAPKEELAAALIADEIPKESSFFKSLTSQDRCHSWTIVQYVCVNMTNPVIPLDGTHIQTNVICTLPTSRGTITLESADPAAALVIDPNYNSTEADKYRIRHGTKTMVKLLAETSTGQEIATGQTLPEGHDPLTSLSSDEEIDKYFCEKNISIGHHAGTASMGKVVDTDFRVFGVQGLRIVDASVLPTPISAAPQACIYAMAEQAVDIILTSSK